MMTAQEIVLFFFQFHFSILGIYDIIVYDGW